MEGFVMSDSDDDFEFGETLDWVAESLRSVAASEVQIKTELGRDIRQKDNSETFTDLEIKMDSDTVTCDSTPPIPSEPNKVKYPRQGKLKEPDPPLKTLPTKKNNVYNNRHVIPSAKENTITNGNARRPRTCKRSKEQFYCQICKYFYANQAELDKHFALKHNNADKERKNGSEGIRNSNTSKINSTSNNKTSHINNASNNKTSHINNARNNKTSHINNANNNKTSHIRSTKIILQSNATERTKSRKSANNNYKNNNNPSVKGATTKVGDHTNITAAAMTVPNNTNAVDCPFCDLKFGDTSSSREHFATNHFIVTFDCDACDACFFNQVELQRHHVIAHDVTTIQCYICAAHFRSDFDIRSHTRDCKRALH